MKRLKRALDLFKNLTSLLNLFHNILTSCALIDLLKMIKIWPYLTFCVSFWPRKTINDLKNTFSEILSREFHLIFLTEWLTSNDLEALFGKFTFRASFWLVNYLPAFNMLNYIICLICHQIWPFVNFWPWLTLKRRCLMKNALNKVSLLWGFLLQIDFVYLSLYNFDRFIQLI